MNFQTAGYFWCRIAGTPMYKTDFTTYPTVITKSRTTPGVSKRALTESNDMCYTVDGAVSDTDSLEESIIKEIVRTLASVYPNPGLMFWWAVEVNESIINIFNLALSGKMGYRLHVSKGASRERIVEAGGHILERYGVPRDPKHYSAGMIIQKHLDNDQNYLKAFH